MTNPVSRPTSNRGSLPGGKQFQCEESDYAPPTSVMVKNMYRFENGCILGCISQKTAISVLTVTRISNTKGLPYFTFIPS